MLYIHTCRVSTRLSIAKVQHEAYKLSSRASSTAAKLRLYSITCAFSDSDSRLRLCMYTVNILCTTSIAFFFNLARIDQPIIPTIIFFSPLSTRLCLYSINSTFAISLTVKDIYYRFFSFLFFSILYYSFFIISCIV